MGILGRAVHRRVRSGALAVMSEHRPYCPLTTGRQTAVAPLTDLAGRPRPAGPRPSTPAVATLPHRPPEPFRTESRADDESPGNTTATNYCRHVQTGRSSGVDATSATPTATSAAGPSLRPALLVGLFAAALRTAWVLIASRPPAGLADPLIYLNSARSIADGHGYTSLLGHPTAYYPPGYPYFLGAVTWVVDAVGLDDHLVLVIGLLQALLGGVAATALVLAGDRLVRARPVWSGHGRAGVVTAGSGVRSLGVIAGLLFACWPNLVLHSALVLSESLFLAAFCVVLAALFTWTDRAVQRRELADGADGAGADGRRPPTAVAGRGPAWLVPVVLVLSTAVCTWVRPQSVVLLVPATVIAWLLGGLGWTRVLHGAALLVVGLLVAVVPWTLRNAVVMDAFVPMSTNTGDNLCIGFHDGATGSFAITDECATEGRYVDGADVEVARDAELRERALRWILDHPGQIPGLSVDKLVATFGYDTDALSAGESFGADRHLSSGTRSAIYSLSNLYYWIVAALALVGATLALRDGWRERPSRSGSPLGAATGLGLLTVAITATGVVVPVLFFGDPRFKVPIVPCLALLAAVALRHGLVARTTRRTEESLPTEPDGTAPTDAPRTPADRADAT